MESKNHSEPESEIKIGNQFTAIKSKKVGSGSFGEIFKGKNVKTGEEVAIKMESNETTTPQLVYESKILKTLEGGVGIPSVYYTCNTGGYTAMVMEMLDKNLEEIMMSLENKKFSLKTLSRIEYMHSKSFIHRDIKPENFLTGLKKKSHLIYLIDYGLAKIYRDRKTGLHIPYVEGKSLTGTARYASIYTHLGIQQSRRDDLEAIGYLLVYFMKGELPWQGLKAKTKKEKYKKIMEKKIASPPEVLCENLPDEFQVYLNYVRGLQFEEKPDYQYLKDLFKKLFTKNDFVNDFIFDWAATSSSTKNSNRNSGIGLFNNTGAEGKRLSIFSNLNFNFQNKNESIEKNEEQHDNTVEVINKISNLCVKGELEGNI